MTIRRAVPDIQTADIAGSSEFYALLGFEETMNLGWVATMSSPSNPTAQVIFISADPSGLRPSMSVEVDDVDAVHEAMVARGAEIVYSLRDEPWGVRRFFVRDPNGVIVNVLTHQ